MRDAEELAEWSSHGAEVMAILSPAILSTRHGAGHVRVHCGRKEGRRGREGGRERGIEGRGGGGQEGEAHYINRKLRHIPHWRPFKGERNHSGIWTAELQY